MFAVSHITNPSTTNKKPVMAEHGVPEQGARDPYVEGNLKMQDVVDFTSEVMCVRFSLDGKLIAVGLARGKIKVVNADTGQVMYSLTDTDIENTPLPVTSLRFCPAPDAIKIEHKHILMATYASGMIKFWHYPSSKCLQTINEVRQTLASAFSPTGNAFVTAGANPQLHMYDYATKKKLRTFEASDSRDVMNGHRARVFAVQYNHLEPNIFVSGGWDDTLQFWDERVKHSIRSVYGPHICGDGLDIDVHHNHILTASWRKDDVLQIWDFASGDKIKDVPQDPIQGSLLYCAQWLGKDNIICGGCEHNVAKVIDRGTLNTVGQLVELPQGVFCVDHEHTNTNRPRIAVGSGCKIYILRLDKR